MKSIKFLEESAKYYDASTDYDSVMAYFDLIEIKPNICGKNFLELGSSAGTITKKLLPLCDSIDIVEASKLALARTKKELKNESKVNYFNSYWEKFVPTRKYSDIFFIRGLEHINNQVSFIKKMSKWLVAGGRIHIIVPNAYSSHKLILTALGKTNGLFELSERDKFLGHTIIYDLPILLTQIKKANCIVIKSKTFFFKPLKHDIMKKISINIKNPLHTILYFLGFVFPKYGAQIYVVCSPKTVAEI